LQLQPISILRSDEDFVVTDYCYKHQLRCRDVINDPVGFILEMNKNQVTVIGWLFLGYIFY